MSFFSYRSTFSPLNKDLELPSHATQARQGKRIGLQQVFTPVPTSLRHSLAC